MKDDKILIQGCIAGNRNDQNALYEKYAAKMYGICLRNSKTKEEAEDILQEGFIQVFKSLKNYRFEGSFAGWIRRIIIFTCIKHFRNKSTMHPVISLESIYEPQIRNEEIVSRLGKKELLNMIQALPPMCRLVFNLYVFEGMKHREIAEHLNIAEGTSKSNLFDAKLILQKSVNYSLKIAKQKF